MGSSPDDVKEEHVMQEKQKKGWRMSCDVGEATERLETEQSSFSNLSITSPMSQCILKPFRCFTYITAPSPTLLLLHLHCSSFSNPSFTSPASHCSSLTSSGELPIIGTHNEWFVLVMTAKDIQKWTGPKFFWLLSCSWGKSLEKNSTRKTDPTGDRTQTR